MLAFLGCPMFALYASNMTVEQTTMMGREAATFLDELDMVRGTTAKQANADLELHPMDAS